MQICFEKAGHTIEINELTDWERKIEEVADTFLIPNLCMTVDNAVSGQALAMNHSKAGWGYRTDDREIKNRFGVKPTQPLFIIHSSAEEAVAWVESEKARYKSKRTKEIEDIKAGKLSIHVSYYDGEYLSGYAITGLAANLLVSLGLAKWVNGWGYLVSDKAVKVLGTEFTYPEAAQFARPRLEEKEARAAAHEAERAAKFEEARRTGQIVLLQKWTEECSDKNEECSLDIITEWALPTGETKIEKSHTW